MAKLCDCSTFDFRSSLTSEQVKNELQNIKTTMIEKHDQKERLKKATGKASLTEQEENESAFSPAEEALHALIGESPEVKGLKYGAKSSIGNLGRRDNVVNWSMIDRRHLGDDGENDGNLGNIPGGQGDHTYNREEYEDTSVSGAIGKKRRKKEQKTSYHDIYKQQAELLEQEKANALAKAEIIRLERANLDLQKNYLKRKLEVLEKE